MICVTSLSLSSVHLASLSQYLVESRDNNDSVQFSVSGVKRLEHNKAVKYYSTLLLQLHQPALNLAIADDADNALAIMDEEPDEGEPDDDIESQFGGDPNLVRQHPKEQELRWPTASGPFLFRVVEHRRNGVLRTDWLADCKQHHDPRDARGTICKKSCTFSGEIEKNIVLRQLKQWILEGRTKTRRWCSENPACAHMSVDFKKFKGRDLFDGDVLDRLASDFVQRPSWCIPPQPDDDTMLCDFVQAPADASDSSDSSSSNSSS